jgi:hypothetical protein
LIRSRLAVTFGNTFPQAIAAAPLRSFSKSFASGELRAPHRAAHASLLLSPGVSEIGLVEISGGMLPTSVAEVAPAGSARGLTLRFLVSADGGRSLDALRDARRSLLREELTRGREPDEPSLEDAVFSTHEILWEVRPEQRLWCLQKLEEVRRRANLLLTEVR